MINRLTIAQKFILISLILLSTMIVMTTLTSVHLTNMRGNIHRIENINLPITKVVASISNNQLQQAILFEKANNYAFEMEIDPDIQLEFDKAVATLETITKDSIKQLKALDKLTTEANNDTANISDQEQLKTLNRHVKEALGQYSLWTSHVSDVLNSLKEFDFQSATASSDKVIAEEPALEEKLHSILVEVDNFTDSSIAGLDSESSSIIREGILFIIVAFIAAGALLFFNVKSISQDIRKVRYSISRMGKGDLNTYPIDKNTGKDLKVMLDDLEDLRTQLSTIISTIVEESSSVSDSAQTMNKLANNSLATIEKERAEINLLAIALKQMESSSSEISHNAESTQDAGRKVIQFSQSSQADMNNAVNSMEKLNQSLRQSAQRITTLEEQGNNIGTVLDVIKSIADQTNLLALNAAIEAARAGEQGRGFAVVADEVRTLAKRTQDSTSEIEEMIGSFKSETNGAVNAMKESQEFAQTMMDAAQTSKNNLFEIGASMENVDEVTQLTASSAEQQTSVIQEVNRNIESVNSLATDNVNASSKVSNESQNMEDISKRLVASVSFFKTSG
ncbi:methyl-accepting chemotaxis protein [Aestuariirhabdus sp. Z084]|uniref:methyl-accepting chemotaxis protein n=1 Tax=Aestuariirhabdus haliotis TaxID=2918751 RepID=UPI00201B43EB|nr:methyl-accepting chemotaxis protein [Aestuariirhabdus haliotis]MCL6416752.1 methyl-accepting chemotaxis protein [Aestuariirhabdus haliotis]MCL6420752.1 methyl-accepting chemotaxis protein [Aestuariirhabdus haliotis]